MIKYKGHLEGFPSEVVERMLTEQERQGNGRDVGVFESDRYRGKFLGGFDWEKTVGGSYFWEKVISKRDFKTFFEKYPRKDVVVPFVPASALCHKNVEIVLPAKKCKVIYAEGKEVIFDLEKVFMEDDLLILKAK